MKLWIVLAALVCTLSDAEREQYLELDYRSFDQTLPDGGWRGVHKHGCGVEAAKLIDAFHEFHKDALEPSEHRLLYFHAGQIYAFEGLTDVALERFRRSLAEEKPGTRSMWNVYVKGTIAFLERDRAALEAARDELVQRSDPNMDILRSMVRCFGRPYKEAYSQNCSH
jgi:hypothetical protein